MAEGFVLVVDDHPDVRKLVCDVLDVMNIPSKEASNGQEAIEMVKTERPDLIVLDLMMPVMDGFTTLTQLRAELGSDNIVPVILLSAIAEDGDSMMRLPGVQGVLRKGSFTVGELRAMMSSVLEANRK